MEEQPQEQPQEQPVEAPVKAPSEAPVETDSNSEEKPKPKWRTSEDGSHSLVDRIEALENDGYDIFSIIGVERNQIIVVGKLRG